MSLKIKSRKYLTLPEVKEILERLSKERELDYTQRITLDYVLKFSKISKEKTVELLKKIMELGIEEELAYQIVNIMPKTLEELSTIVGGRAYSDENMKEVINLINSYLSEG
ncbi:MAG: RNA polymerase Rpb4 family protein [Candidatus Asgardarchaeia archaeon]